MEFVRGKGRFVITEYVPDRREGDQLAAIPLLLTTGRILSPVQRRCADAPYGEFVMWHDEDKLEIHPHDAEERGIHADDWVGISSRSGETVLRATITERMPAGVVYTTFHFPESGANVITTDSSDWATNCPEYKVTAVQVLPVAQPSSWQRAYKDFDSEQQSLLAQAQAAPALVVGK